MFILHNVVCQWRYTELISVIIIIVQLEGYCYDTDGRSSQPFIDCIFTGISLTFRTTQQNALLFFAASAGIQDEYIVIQMSAGRLWFLFDPQGQHNMNNLIMNNTRHCFWSFPVVYWTIAERPWLRCHLQKYAFRHFVDFVFEIICDLFARTR